MTTQSGSLKSYFPSKVYDVLNNLPGKKAGGLEGITLHLLRACAPGVAVSPTFLFKQSFRGVFPSAWKRLVIPAFKRGDKSNPTNYRPISLLSSVAKADLGQCVPLHLTVVL